MLPARDEEPGPAGCELVRQRAGVLLGQLEALTAGIAADPDRPDLARRMSLLTAALREDRAWLAGHVLADELAASIAARAEARGYERGLAAGTGRRKARHAPVRSGAVLRLAPAVAAAAVLLRRSLGRHPVVAAARASLAAHKIAAAAVTTAAAGSTAAVLTVTALGPNVTLPFTGSAGAPAPAASIYGAVPVPLPGSSLIAQSVTRPKAETARARRDRASLAPVPSPVSLAPSGSSPSSQPSQPSSSQGTAGPATLTVSTTALDLSAGNPVTITLSATGAAGSWVSWNVDTVDAATGVKDGDLDFSQSHGVLEAGQSATVTVSVDPAQATDGDASETFSVAGTDVTATLPAAVVPAVEPSVVPTPVPSVLPSLPV